jgi:hypothetical protein
LRSIIRELVEDQRLGQIVVGPFLQGLHGGGDRRVAGHHDDFDGLVLLLHLAQQLETAHVGHADIGDQGIEELGFQETERLGRRGGHRDLVAPLAERLLEEQQDGALVVDDQDFRWIHRTCDSSMQRCQTDK